MKKKQHILYFVEITNPSGYTFVKIGVTGMGLDYRFQNMINKGYSVSPLFIYTSDAVTVKRLESGIKYNPSYKLDKYRPVFNSFTGHTECFTMNAKPKILSYLESL